MKIISFIFAILLTVTLIGCQSNKTEEDFSAPNDNMTAPNDDNSLPGDDLPVVDADMPIHEIMDSMSAEPGESIDVYGLSEFSKMHEMLGCTDEKELDQYLRSVTGGGAHSKKDLEMFIKLVKSLPLPELLEGEVTWLSYSPGYSVSTGKEYCIFYVSIEASDGSWVRYEYNLMVTDAKKGIDEKIQTMDASSVIAKPIQSADKRMTVYAEQRKTTETGNTVTWLADIDGVYARIVYNVGTNPYPVTDYFLTNVSISEFQYN